MANVDKFALMVNITEAAARFFDLCLQYVQQLPQERWLPEVPANVCRGKRGKVLYGVSKNYVVGIFQMHTKIKININLILLLPRLRYY